MASTHNVGRFPYIFENRAAKRDPCARGKQERGVRRYLPVVDKCAVGRCQVNYLENTGIIFNKGMDAADRLEDFAKLEAGLFFADRRVEAADCKDFAIRYFRFNGLWHKRTAGTVKRHFKSPLP